MNYFSDRASDAVISLKNRVDNIFECLENGHDVFNEVKDIFKDFVEGLNTAKTRILGEKFISASQNDSPVLKALTNSEGD